VAGLYRFTEDNNVDFRVFLATNSYLSFIQPEVTAKSWAAFGQGTYAVTDRLRLTAGLRYTEDQKGRNGGTYLTNAAGAITSTVILNVADAKWDALNWKVGGDFDLTDSSMLYANAPRAIRPAAITTAWAPTPTSLRKSPRTRRG
jgi:iron complex outermembrane receptor protein